MLEHNIYEYLEHCHIDYQVVEHKAIDTIEEMLQQDIPHHEWIVKNLFLRDDKKRHYYLLVLEQSKKVQMKDLRNKINSRSLSFASNQDLLKYLKVPQGSVTPLAVFNDDTHNVEVIIDKDITEMIGIHPLINTKTIFMKKVSLIQLLKDCSYTVKEIKI